MGVTETEGRLRLKLTGAVSGVLAGGLVGTIVAGPTAAMAGDPVAGLAKSAICASCHGVAGRSPVPSFPDLAGQNAAYIEYALQLYQKGERKGEQASMMYVVTQALSEEDISDLAAYFSTLE